MRVNSPTRRRSPQTISTAPTKGPMICGPECLSVKSARAPLLGEDKLLDPFQEKHTADNQSDNHGCGWRIRAGAISRKASWATRALNVIEQTS